MPAGPKIKILYDVRYANGYLNNIMLGVLIEKKLVVTSIIVAIIIIVIIYFYQKNKSNSSSDIEFTFSVKNLNKDELANLKGNHSVNFWQKPNTYTVFIYRAGTMGGRGRIGIVPDKIRRILRAHFNNYTVAAAIDSIRDLDETTLKYYEHIPGSVRIYFHKNV